MNYKPTIVLQHPHTTDSKLTWLQGWSKLIKMVPTIKEYASAGRYYNNGNAQRSELEDVLERTHRGSIINIIVRAKKS